MMMQDAAELRAAHMTLPVGDADVYIFCQALLGMSRSERFAEPPPAEEATPLLSRALTRLVPLSLLRFIAHNGGERRARVVRESGGRARVVDVALSGNDDDGAAGVFDVRSVLFASVVYGLCKEVMGHIDKRQAGELTLAVLGRAERQRLRTVLPPKAEATGDHIAYTCAAFHLRTLGLPAPYDTLLMRSFAQSSPLAAMLTFDDPDLHDVDLPALMHPPLLRPVELLLPLLSEAIADAARRVTNRSGSGEEVRARSACFAARARALVKVLDDANRLDLIELLTPFVLALPDIAPVRLRTRLVRLEGVTTMADRDRVIAAVDGMFAVADDVYAAVDRLAATRFGDDRSIEARVVAGLTEPLHAAREAVGASRVVGHSRVG